MYELNKLDIPESWPLNETTSCQLHHRTIRAFTDDKVDDDTLAMLSELVNRTASSTGMQQASWIRITDPEIRQGIAAVCKQEYVATAPELWIFIVDCYRNMRLAEAHGFDTSKAGSMDRFVQGFTDASLMAQNLNSAVASLGLGAVFLGSILNDPPEIIRLLNLPQLTFPVIGVAFGKPAQSPQYKPRMPVALRQFENQYTPEDDYAEAFREYDEVMTWYYDLRDENKRLDSFSQQVKQKLSQVNPIRQRINVYMEEQGFDLRTE